MNRFEGPRSNQARLRYLDGEFQVLSSGAYVVCAVTSEHIPLDELKYWSVARQEPYVNGVVSHQRELECNPEMRVRGRG